MNTSPAAASPAKATLGGVFFVRKYVNRAPREVSEETWSRYTIARRICEFECYRQWAREALIQRCASDARKWAEYAREEWKEIKPWLLGDVVEAA